MLPLACALLLAAAQAAGEEPTQAAKPAEAWSIQFATMRSSAGAERALAELRERHLELVDPLALAVDPPASEQKKSIFRVLSRPLPDRALAQTVCNRLRAQHLDCVVVAAP